MLRGARGWRCAYWLPTLLVLAGIALPARAGATSFQWPQYVAGPVAESYTYAATYVTSYAGEPPVTCHGGNQYSYSGQAVYQLTTPPTVSPPYYDLVSLRAVTATGSASQNCPPDAPINPAAGNEAWTSTLATSAGPITGHLIVGPPPHSALIAYVPYIVTSCTGPGCQPNQVGSISTQYVGSDVGTSSIAGAPVVAITRPTALGSAVNIDVTGSKQSVVSTPGNTETSTWTYNAHFRGVSTSQALKLILKNVAKVEAQRALLESSIQCIGLALTAHGLAGALTASASPIGPAPQSAALADMAIGAYGQYSLAKNLAAGTLQGLQVQANNCAAALVWLLQAYKVLQDPPVGSPDTVALPLTPVVRPVTLCGRYSGSLRRSCNKLSRLLLAHTRDTARVMATYDAILVAVDQLSSAQSSGDLSGAALQTAVIEALHSELAIRQGTLDKDDAALGALLQRFMRRARLSAAVTRAIRRYVTSREHRLGIPASSVTNVAHWPQRLDLIAVLRRGVSLSSARSLGSAITINDVRALVDAVSSSNVATTLNADLDRLAQASGAAAQHSAVAQFTHDTRGLSAEAAQLLVAAVGPLG